MNRAIVVWALLPLLASASNREASHAPISPSNDRRTTNEQYASRLNELFIHRLIQQHMAGASRPAGGASIDQLLAANPAFGELIKGVSEGDPKAVEQANEYAKRFSKATGMSSRDLQKQIEQIAQQSLPSSTFAEKPDQQESTRPIQAALNAPAERDLQWKRTTQRMNELLRKWNLEEFSRNWRDSRAFQDLKNMPMDGRSAGPLKAEQVESLLAFADSFAHKLKDLLPESIPKLPQLDLSMPDIGGGLSFGTSSFPSAGAVSDAAIPVLMAVAIAVAITMLWRISAQTKASARVSRRAQYQLVDPDHLTTREDLILAFERLALVFFGEDAAHWHHHRVAERLAQIPNAQHDSQTLTRFYEQARYAPAKSGIDWTIAREPLRRLSGNRP